MANARFIYGDVVRYASGITFLPPTIGAWSILRPNTFILSPWRKKVTRSNTSTASVDMIIDLGAAFTFTSAFLVNVKLHIGGNVRLQAHGSNSWGAPAFDSGAFPAVDIRRRLTGLYFNAQTFRYIRLLWTNVGAVNDYAELGYLFLGMTTYNPTYNITDNLSINPVDPSLVSEAYDGEVQAFKKTHYDEIDAFLESMPTVDKTAYETMFRDVGLVHPLIFSVDSAELPMTYYGYFTDTKIEFSEGTVSDWDITFGFKEGR